MIAGENIPFLCSKKVIKKDSLVYTNLAQKEKLLDIISDSW